MKSTIFSLWGPFLCHVFLFYLLISNCVLSEQNSSVEKHLKLSNSGWNIFPKMKHTNLLSNNNWSALKTYLQVIFYRLISLYWGKCIHMHACTHIFMYVCHIKISSFFVCVCKVNSLVLKEVKYFNVHCMTFKFYSLHWVKALKTTFHLQYKVLMLTLSF